MKHNIYILLSIIALLLISCHTEVDVYGDIEGAVQEYGTQTPLENCLVELLSSKSVTKTKTNESGVFSFSHEEMGDKKLVVSKNGYITDTAAIFIKSSITTQTTIFLKKAQTPSLQTKPATEIKSTSANLHGYVVNDGGIQLSQVGFYFGTDPARMDKRICDKVSMDYSLQVQGLSDNTMYYFKAFAVNETGEGTGELLSFETSELNKPIVETLPATGITGYTATLNGQILDKGSSDIVSCGFYYGLSTEDMQKHPIQEYDYPNLHLNLENLKDGTLYYYSVYAANDKGEELGKTMTFTTTEYKTPVVQTYKATDITSTGATLNGNISDNGGLDIIEYGFYYGKSPQTLQKIKVGESISNSFAYTISGLLSGQEYFYQTYALNEKEEGRGELVIFETPNKTVPIVGTIGVSSISYNSANLLGNVNNLAESSDLSEYGFYLGTSEKPDMKIKVGNGVFSGDYSISVSDLVSSTKYYYQAYAVNNAGEGLGTINNFYTYGVPSVEIYSPLELTSNEIICFGNVISINGADITEFGICYSSADNNPTIYSSTIMGSGSFNGYRCTITKYKYSTTYYVRCYAKNSYGVGYSDVLSIETPTEPVLSVVGITSTYDDITTYTISGTSVSYKYMLQPKFQLSNPDNVPIKQIGYYYSVNSVDLDIQNIEGTSQNRAICIEENSIYSKKVELEYSTYYSTLYIRPYIISHDTIWQSVLSILPTYKNVWQ